MQSFKRLVENMDLQHCRSAIQIYVYRWIFMALQIVLKFILRIKLAITRLYTW